MIIDFHTHTYPDKIAKKVVEKLQGACGTKAYTDGTEIGLLNNMKSSAVDLSVILPVSTNPAQTEKINQGAVLIREKYNNKSLISFGGIHPDNDNYKEILRNIKNEGLKGIKLHPDYQDTFFNDIKYKRIIEFATELDLIVITHAGTDIGLPNPVHTTPDMILEVIKSVNPEKLVLAHMGGWHMWDEVINKLAGQNIYLDTAFSYGKIECVQDKAKKWQLLSQDKFEKMIKAFGADKILFGTDSPWSYAKTVIEDINALNITDNEKKSILGENGKKLLFL